MRKIPLSLTLSLALFFAGTAHAQQRPMTFLDMRQMKQGGAFTPSPNGQWMLFTVSVPNWKEAKQQTDIYLVNMLQGVASTKQLTFTKEKSETSPAWSRDGSWFAYLSDRDGG